MPKRSWFFLWIICALAWAAPAAAAPTNDEIMKRLDELSRTVAAQNELLKAQSAEIDRLKSQLGEQSQAVQATQKQVKEVKQVADAKSAPAKGIKDLLGDKFSFSTDLRLRYEGIYDRQQGKTELADRHRYRVRWRVFGGYKLNDELRFDSMLTTSSGSWFSNGSSSRNWQPGRTSNQTMDDEFNNKDVFIGRIYATYQPKWAPGLDLVGGKFKNTFLHTDIMWDPDVNPEGVYERYQYSGWKTVQPFVQFGQMVVAENNKTADAYLFLWQAGADFKLGKDVKLTLAGSYYDWQNLNKSDMSKVDGSSAGNSVGADGNFLYDYKLLEGLAFLEFKLGGIPVMLWLDYINNTAGGVPADNDTAWSTGFEVGKTKKKGDWAVYFKYAVIDPDAVVGAVADGDFYGANRKGYKVQARYQLFDPWLLAASWFQTDTQVGAEDSENRLQLDMIFKFSL